MAEKGDLGVAEEQISWVNSDELEAESVYISDNVNVDDGVNVDGGVFSSSGSLEPYIGMKFEDMEDAQTFYKAYARRKGFAIWTNHTRLLKDDKTLCAVDYVCTRAGFQQYEKAIDARYFKEKEKDVRTKFTQAILKTPLKIEEEAATVYTRKSFTIIQAELFDSLRYQAKNLSKKGETKTYGVKAYGKETPLYHVTLEGDEGHATYRWTMNAKSRPIPDIPCFEGQVQQGEDEATMRKFKSMIQLYDIVELASQSIKKHNHFTLALEKVHKELLAMEDHVEYSDYGFLMQLLPLCRDSKGLVATSVAVVVEVRRIRESPYALLRQRGDSLVALP
ncbi:hypothetical protein EZV62_023708 [Acer yangbiense]|uniref:Protein FAR1-RELATED SEQUENCE n=1 Tax=Acer yangbiense TaxID=1000413 RepID=A0A5C7H2F0_9ROSI|nr:hypothetical protein EZV62_023708 [Acer yangbiense]